ncbi:MAG: zinc-ribbon domain-containing protein [Pyrinomonadaceae bacterium]
MTKLCPKCNQPNLPEAVFCANCASPLTPAPVNAPSAAPQQWPPQRGPMVGQPAPATGAGSKAVIALVLGIAAFLCCGPFAGIPAAIVGWMELNAIKSGQSSPDGKWMAMVGLCGGLAATVIHVVVYIIYIVFTVLATSNPYGY